MNHLAFRKMIIEIVLIHPDATSDMPQIVDTVGTAASFLGSIENGKQQSRKNGNDRNHNEEVDQGKPIGFASNRPTIFHFDEKKIDAEGENYQRLFR